MLFNGIIQRNNLRTLAINQQGERAAPICYSFRTEFLQKTIGRSSGKGVRKGNDELIIISAVGVGVSSTTLDARYRIIVLSYYYNGNMSIWSCCHFNKCGCKIL
jgi:hypothetical protein